MTEKRGFARCLKFLVPHEGRMIPLVIKNPPDTLLAALIRFGGSVISLADGYVPCPQGGKFYPFHPSDEDERIIIGVMLVKSTHNPPWGGMFIIDPDGVSEVFWSLGDPNGAQVWENLSNKPGDQKLSAEKYSDVLERLAKWGLSAREEEEIQISMDPAKAFKKNFLD